MNRPLVSIALRSYNQKEFLKESLDSILAQTYQNIKIIVADDASTDGSPDLIKNYQKQYPDKITPLLNETNLGHTKNLNNALAACKGKYVSIFDGDDIMHPQKIEKQVEFMEQNPNCSICYHNTEFFDNETNKILYIKNHQNNSYQGGVKTMIKYGMFTTNISNLILKEKIPAKGADERISIASDWIFYVETLMNGGEIQYLDEILARVRRHPNNITQTRFLKNLSDQYLSSFIILKKYPKYTFQVIFRWFNGFWNQFKTSILKKYN
jgi:glycosyltransferase involved in cell wall biosynthesis